MRNMQHKYMYEIKLIRIYFYLCMNKKNKKKLIVIIIRFFKNNFSKIN